MYRSLGRMFVLVPAEELKADLTGDIQKVGVEMARSEQMMKNFTEKKDALTKQLNDMSPKTS